MAEMQSNRNDDLFGSTDKQFGTPNIDSLALKYSKAQLQQMAQMGRIPPIYAVMAGMAQDRIQLNNSQAPKTTVVNDVFAPKTQMAGVAPGNAVPGNGGREMPGGSIQEIKARTHGAEMGWDPRNSAADISRAHGGLMSIPRPGEKYNQDNFATGGIVAFQEGGDVRRGQALNYDPKARMPIEDILQFEGLIGGKRKKKEEKVATPIDPATATNGLPPIYSADSVFQQPDPFGRAPTSTVGVETQKQLAKVQPTGPAEQPTGPLAAMVQQEAQPSLEDVHKQLGGMYSGVDKFGEVHKQITDAQDKGPEALAGIRNLALTQAGAKMMAGTSQFAMTNIGEGILAGANSYAQQLQDKKKLDKGDRDDLFKIAQLQQLVEQGKVDKASEVYRTMLTNMTTKEVHAADGAVRMAVQELANKQSGINAATAAGSKLESPDMQLINAFRKDDPKLSMEGAVGKVASLKREPMTDEKLLELWSKDLLLRKQYPTFSEYKTAIYGQQAGGGGYQPTASQLKALNKNQG